MQYEKPKIYLETSVVSYLTARGSRDLLMMAHQQITREWWEQQRPHYALFVSDLVYLEAERGDSEAAKRRIEVIEGCGILEETDEVRDLAEMYIEEIPLLKRAGADALHMAMAAWHEMDYLLTWNCRHIANALITRRLAEINWEKGIFYPTICTPEELLHGNQDVD